MSCLGECQGFEACLGEVFDVDPYYSMNLTLAHCRILGFERKHTGRLCWRNLAVSTSAQHSPHNLVARVELRQGRNWVNHPAKHHSRTQCHQLILDFMISNIVPRSAFGNNLGCTVCDRLECVSSRLDYNSHHFTLTTADAFSPSSYVNGAQSSSV